MDLLCTEMTDHNLAPMDAVIYKDERVLDNMLQLDDTLVPKFNYFHGFQKSLEPYMREIVIEWMHEVSGIFVKYFFNSHNDDLYKIFGAVCKQSSLRTTVFFLFFHEQFENFLSIDKFLFTYLFCTWPTLKNIYNQFWFQI